MKLRREFGCFPPIRFHDLRHSAATLLLARRVNPKIVSQMPGHPSIELTLDTYGHVVPDVQRVIQRPWTRGPDSSLGQYLGHQRAAGRRGVRLGRAALLDAYACRSSTSLDGDPQAIAGKGLVAFALRLQPISAGSHVQP